MLPPTCRSELEHNVYLLVDDIERHIDDAAYLRNRVWAMGDSLERLRYLPNRRIELLMRLPLVGLCCTVFFCLKAFQVLDLGLVHIYSAQIM